MFQKQKRTKAHEEIEFYNSIQDWVFATVYWGSLSACFVWFMASSGTKQVESILGDKDSSKILTNRISK